MYTLKLSDIRALIALLTTIPCIWTIIPQSLDNNIALLWFQLEIAWLHIEQYYLMTWLSHVENHLNNGPWMPCYRRIIELVDTMHLSILSV
jgi:hypothetical protein